LDVSARARLQIFARDFADDQRGRGDELRHSRWRQLAARLPVQCATNATYLRIDSQVPTKHDDTSEIDRICITVVGSGYVGLVAGACFAEIGHEVILVDSDASKISALIAGKVPIHEEFLPELIERHAGTALLHPGSQRGSAIFITVGTPPTEEGDADLSYVEQVAYEITGAIDRYKVVVEKSTVPVYTHEWVRRTMILNGAPEDLFSVVSNPSFCAKEVRSQTSCIPTASASAPTRSARPNFSSASTHL